MSVKPLLLGEAPSRGLAEWWAQPLYGPTCRRLLHMMGVAADPKDERAYRQLTNVFDVRNAVELHGHAYPWTAAVTEEAHQRWVRFMLDRRDSVVLAQEQLVVVCLGRKAAAATRVAAHLDFFEWGLGSAFYRFVVIPHPSGLNRLYNDSIIERTAGNVLKAAIKMQREGW